MVLPVAAASTRSASPRIPPRRWSGCAAGCTKNPVAAVAPLQLQLWRGGRNYPTASLWQERSPGSGRSSCVWMSLMSRPTRMVSKDRWRLDDLGDPERTSRLLNPPSSLALMTAVAADAARAAHDDQICPDWDPSFRRPGFGRILATIPVSRDHFDQLFNGRSGYRAQYCLSVKEGRQYNRALVDALVPALRYAHANLSDPRLRWCDVEQSLTGSYSKIWIADDQEHFQNAPAALHVPGWMGWGLRVPLPSSPKLDVKGTFIRPGSRDEFTTKPYRDRDLHRVGSPG